MSETLVARILGSLALGFLLAAIGYGVDSIVIWHDFAHGAAELGKVGVALGASLLVFNWSRHRSAKRAKRAPTPALHVLVDELAENGIDLREGDES